MITDEFDELLPRYLGFMKGVVDPDSLPLNVSREMLQDHPLLTKIKNGLTKKVLSELETAAKKDAAYPDVAASAVSAVAVQIDAAINLAIRAGVWMSSLRRMRSLLIIRRALERMQPH